MTYDNITEATTDRMENWVHTNWVTNQDAGIFKKECLSRVAYLVLAPASFIPRAIDTILTLGAILGGLFSRPTTNFIGNRKFAVLELLSRPYHNLLKVIQPARDFSYRQAWVSHEGRGFITEVAFSCIQAFTKSIKIKEKSNPATHNRVVVFIASRTLYALILLITPITRIADACLSVPATALSLLLLGTCDTLNNIAYRTLQAPMILPHTFAAFVMTCRPGVRV